MSDLIQQIQVAQRNAGEAAVIASLKASGLITEPPATYVDGDGIERNDRRRKSRDGDDERIQHLFDGFNSRIATARMNGDKYGAGYLTAMRQEFGQLIASLVH